MVNVVAARRIQLSLRASAGVYMLFQDASEMRRSHKAVIDLGAVPETLPADLEVVSNRKLSDLASLHAPSLREYPHMSGSPELREAAAAFIRTHFGLTVDSRRKVAVVNGILGGLSDFTHGLRGRRVLLPRESQYIVHQVVSNSGAASATFKSMHGGSYSISRAAMLRQIAKGGVKLAYFNNPLNPYGKVLQAQNLMDVLRLLERHGIPAIEDFDTLLVRSMGAGHVGPAPVASVSSLGATIFTVSKELDLPGARVGVAFGNARLIRVLRQARAARVEMPSSISEPVAAYVLQKLANRPELAEKLRNATRNQVRATVSLLREHGWPAEVPEADFTFTVPIPHTFRRLPPNVVPSHFFAYYMLNAHGIHVVPVARDRVRIIAKRSDETLSELGKRLGKGLSWQELGTKKPTAGLIASFKARLARYRRALS